MNKILIKLSYLPINAFYSLYSHYVKADDLQQS